MPTPIASQNRATEDDSAAEDPYPGPFRAHGGAAAAAIAVGPSELLPATAVMSTSVSPAMMAVAVACFGVATFGALGSSSLAVYSPTKLHNRLDSKGGEALVAEFERREREYRVVARFYLVGGLIGALLALQSAVDAATMPWAMAGLIGMALLTCGSLPSAIADARAEATLLRILPILRGGLVVLRWPLVLPVLALTRGALRALRIRAEPSSDPGEIAEEVMAAVSDSMTMDTLADQEKAWIGNIVGLKDLQISTIMTPRPDLVAIRADTPLQLAIQQAQEHGFSRYPVYRDRVDEIVGIFYVKDTLRIGQPGGPSADAPTSTMMRPPLFVPESMGVPQLLRRMQTEKVHMAVVLDEYGTTAGVISVEDILEQIVGDIDDEYDAAEADLDSDQVTVVQAGHVVEVPGRTSVEEVNKLLGLHLSDDGDWETIAGFVIHSLNRIPGRDESLQIDGVEFHVLQADDRRVDRLRVTAPAPEPAHRDD